MRLRMIRKSIHAVEPATDIKQLEVPLWFWNSAEWSAFTQASSKTQRPTLIQSLRTVRNGQIETALTPSHEMRRFLRTIVSIIQIDRNTGKPWGGFCSIERFYGKNQEME